MARTNDELDEAALDFAKTRALACGIHLTDHDITMLELGILCGSLVAWREIGEMQDESLEELQKRRKKP